MFNSAKGNQITETIAGFLAGIGIEMRAGETGHETFLPGIEVVSGALVVDEEKLLYPGDLLHEAGHLAVLAPAERRQTSTTVDTGPGEEMAVIAWSYAAALHLGIDPAVVFHPAGYKGDAQWIIDNFSAGQFFGVPLLAWMGLTVEKDAVGQKSECYPKMTKWVRND